MRRPLLLIHGGAGPRLDEQDGERRQGCLVALEAGWRVLAAGGSALDAVTSAVAALEDDPLFNAGVGSCLTAAGAVEMDASIMDGGRGRAGGVAAVTTVRNPIRLARAILDDGRHVLLVGSGAEGFARAHGVATAPPEHFVVSRQRQRWMARHDRQRGTVGAVALDADGHLAAATSTGGLTGKLPGRVGDSAIIGAGTYADDGAGCGGRTGDGEAIILASLARTAVDLLRDGTHPRRVAARLVGGPAAFGASMGIILVDRFGRTGAASNTPSMITALRTPVACTVVDGKYE